MGKYDNIDCETNTMTGEVVYRPTEERASEPKTNYEKMKEIQSYYGREAQIDKCAEECGELIQALMKFRNADKDDSEYKKKFDNLLEEIADVQITTSEVLLSLGGEDFINKKIQDLIDYKLDRQLRRIRDEEEG